MFYCDHRTREKCNRFRKSKIPCNKVHWIKLKTPYTNQSLGDCSYLDTCRHMDGCKFIHYELEKTAQQKIINPKMSKSLTIMDIKSIKPSQWINCDLRKFDYSVLGKCQIVMADPPWDIHMDLPYGTLKDFEMRQLPLQQVQDDGLIFLWVTGRALELGMECLNIWGYRLVQELIWIKTNQLQRIIRTGRTGHWLNHSKEHCIVGMKGNPKINKNIDCDVLVSEVRETSRKPDEIYGIIERLCPGGRKIELFGRPHNRCPGWITLGNQLPKVYLTDQDIIERYKIVYPNQDLSLEAMRNNLSADKTFAHFIYNNHIVHPLFHQQKLEQIKLQKESK